MKKKTSKKAEATEEESVEALEEPQIIGKLLKIQIVDTDTGEINYLDDPMLLYEDIYLDFLEAAMEDSDVKNAIEEVRKHREEENCNQMMLSGESVFTNDTTIVKATVEVFWSDIKDYDQYNETNEDETDDCGHA